MTEGGVHGPAKSFLLPQAAQEAGRYGAGLMAAKVMPRVSNSPADDSCFEPEKTSI